MKNFLSAELEICSSTVSFQRSKGFFNHLLGKVRKPLAFFLVFLCCASVSAQQESGDVTLSLELYNQLVETSKDPKTSPVPAPASYALGKADLQVSVAEKDGRVTGEISVSLSVRVFVDEWVAVPLLKSGTAVKSVTVNGAPAQLVSTGKGLFWSTSKSGVYSLGLSYSLDSAFSEKGRALAIPVPAASAMNLKARLPGHGLDVAVIPSAGLRVSPSAAGTTIAATVPATDGILLSWRNPVGQTHAMSRADYRGVLEGNAVAWQATYNLELFQEDGVTLELLPEYVTLRDLKVDGKTASVLLENGHFATVVKGAGNHQVSLSFEVSLSSDEGPPGLTMPIARVPISRIQLQLPGKKEVTVQPFANVTTKQVKEGTLATVAVPLTQQVRFSWTEAVPEDVKREVRANADLIHTVHAEEGVLHLHAMAQFNVARGQTNRLVFLVPYDAQVNEVRSSAGHVAEWIPNRGEPGKPYQLTVFLDRQVQGEIRTDIYYERPLPAGETVPVPLLRAMEVNRQRGMVALLADKDFTLKPLVENGVSRVGENQLPTHVRKTVERTIAHTFKYLEAEVDLQVQPAKPERKEGKFDAEVNTLISLGDVTMRGASGLEINVKSGGIMAMSVQLPTDVNLLSLAAPSLRTYKVNAAPDGQTIDLQFTQEMEGQFRIDVVYEHITSDTQSEVVVPTPGVAGAEVEQGRIAVEALSAVEVQAATVTQLSSLDVNELPKQLILKTTNPILLAYKYVQTENPFHLGLRITRHSEIDVQAATIDQATYKTLYTRDGLAVTTAQFSVRNSRKQFIRVKLPPDSEVWSAFVAGEAVKPALVRSHQNGSENGEGGSHILIKIINSAEGFPVELIYATPVAKIESLGKVKGFLPRPDIGVTHSRWEVYLPDGFRYGNPHSNMEILESRVPIDRVSGQDGAIGLKSQEFSLREPLKIDVPTAGIRYAFKKLYANRSDEEAGFEIVYASVGGTRLSWVVGVFATLLLWVGLWGALRRSGQRLMALGIAFAGLLLLVIPLGYFGTGLRLPIITTLVLALAIGTKWVGHRVPFGAWASARNPLPQGEIPDSDQEKTD